MRTQQPHEVHTRTRQMRAEVRMEDEEDEERVVEEHKGESVPVLSMGLPFSPLGGAACMMRCAPQRNTHALSMSCETASVSALGTRARQLAACGAVLLEARRVKAREKRRGSGPS